VNSLDVVNGPDLGQEGGIGGPNLPVNSLQSVTGGVSRRANKLDEFGLSPKPNSNSVCGEGKGELKKGGLYSNGLEVFMKCLTTIHYLLISIPKVRD
jgi:hypothetical protein